MAQRSNCGQALDRMLRDRLVCYLRDAGVRRNLLAQSTLSLQEAEEAARNVHHMGDGQMSEDVNALRKKQAGQLFRTPQLRRMAQSSDENQNRCLCCGSDHRRTTKCRFRHAECFPLSVVGAPGFHVQIKFTPRKRPPLTSSGQRGLRTVSTTPPRVIDCRQLQVPVTYTGKTVNATLVVLGCSGSNLCGRDIIQAFQLTRGPVLNVDVNDGSRPRRHSAGEPLWCRNYGAGASWRPAVIQTTRGARLSTVKTEDGELCERHEYQLRYRFEGAATNPVEEHETGPATIGVPEQPDRRTENNEPPDNSLRRSTRRRKAPNRF
ncbi:hypothetical protein MRX96_004228 [Rhipicephalus microplus]